MGFRLIYTGRMNIVLVAKLLKVRKRSRQDYQNSFRAESNKE